MVKARAFHNWGLASVPGVGLGMSFVFAHGRDKGTKLYIFTWYAKFVWAVVVDVLLIHVSRQLFNGKLNSTIVGSSRKSVRALCKQHYTWILFVDRLHDASPLRPCVLKATHRFPSDLCQNTPVWSTGRFQTPITQPNHVQIFNWILSNLVILKWIPLLHNFVVFCVFFRVTVPQSGEARNKCKQNEH